MLAVPSHSQIAEDAYIRAGPAGSTNTRRSLRWRFANLPTAQESGDVAAIRAVAARRPRHDRGQEPVRHIRRLTTSPEASPAVSSHSPGYPHLGGGEAGRRAWPGCAMAEGADHAGSQQFPAIAGRPRVHERVAVEAGRRAANALREINIGNAAAGLCGGMVFAALDFWHTGIQPPATRPARANRCIATSCGVWSTRGTCRRGWPSTTSG